MLRVGTWLYNRSSLASSSTQSLDSLAEAQELENALRAATLIMDDDVDGAEEGLKKGSSSFHMLGKGVVAFVRATLGFEQDIMRQASERLNDAETSAYNAHRRALHSAHAANAHRSAIYDPGTEYILCQSMAQLMAALVGVLNETLTESVKAFYKLRKAYIALDSIMQMEERYLQTHSPPKSTSSNNFVPGKGSSSASSPIPAGPENELPNLPSSRPVRSRDDSDIDNSRPAPALNGDKDSPKNASSADVHLTHDPDSDLFSNPVDAFIHSGTNLCFGLLLLLISMVPPAFSKLLYIVGFRGDRARGLRMLWQASKFHSLTGAISSLALLAFYNGFVRCCDIIPDPSDSEDDQIQGYPMERLANLLHDMRQRFPKSQLWLLEESRMQSANRKLDVALDLLTNTEKSPLKQVQALLVFEKSMDSMYLHKYQLCADSFIECVELNSWSRALYYYIAGACHLSLYRENAKGSPSIAEQHASKATELFRKAPSQAGKKRFMAKQLPFDVLVMRKIAKWEARAKEWNVDFVDAVGVDPVEEMIFFWNGHNRMSTAQLQDSLKRLEWSESSENKTWHREDLDEKAILALLRGGILRSLRRHDESKETLRAGILCHDKAMFKGHLKDDWTCPTAHYEMASNLWMERYSYRPARGEVLPIRGDENGTGSPDKASANGANGEDTSDELNESHEAHDRAKVRECGEWIEKVARWEAFELDARVGLKVATAEETIRKWELAHPSS